MGLYLELLDLEQDIFLFVLTFFPCINHLRNTWYNLRDLCLSMSSGARSFRGRGGAGRSGSSHATNMQPSTFRPFVSFVPPQQSSEVPLSWSSWIGASSSYTSMAQLRDQLKVAHRKIEEQAAENKHHRAKVEEAIKVAEEAKVVAQQSQVTVASLEMLVAYMREDPRYARFVEARSQDPSTSTPQAQQ